jgi:uncharacterized membrane protein (DUF2068 family)
MTGPGSARQTGESGQGTEGQDHSRLLPLLALERSLRAVVLIGIGLILATHVHSDWAALARQFAEQVGLDPSRNVTGRLISKLVGFGSQKAIRDAIIAIGYGLLEAGEAYGLLRRRPWAEYLTVISTALLFIPEIQELITKPTALKICALLLNLLVVGYLTLRLLRRHHTSRDSRAAEQGSST